MMMVQYLLDADARGDDPGGRGARDRVRRHRRAGRARARAGAARVSDQIAALAGVAREEGDYQSEQFMQWFLKEQVEEVAIDVRRC